MKMKRLFNFGFDEPYILFVSIFSGLILIGFNFKKSWRWGVLLLLFGLWMVFANWQKYRLIDRLISKNDLSNVKKGLDLGSGSGYFLIDAVKNTKLSYFVGVEDQYQNSKRIRRNVDKYHVQNQVNIINQDIHELSYANRSFDLITASNENNSNITSTNAKEYQSLCDEIYRMLKPNCKFMMVNTPRITKKMAKYFESKGANVQMSKIKIQPLWGLRTLVMTKKY
ncbi:hypothetical protein WR164_03820 [Philodulcilactobacillus myokoensis]|uniref:Methyltransferase domain-containing protein n=1 Tax=Philodulcilactobacillus myokoensis TaxID=2929573 RepID=A0A9W6ESJ8_9LACO|nr:class I SAM-dependent methyltransferase [Philodulcilactobacillus myokoensis]GLB46403.1 hypothetical protein WR164_03820 [Philodulcilactobacillus myokoensis]